MTRAIRLLTVAALATVSTLILRAAQESSAQSGKVELTVIAASSIRAAGEQLIPDFERKTGNKVIASWVSGGTARQEVVQGDVFDVAVVHPPYQEIIDSGNVMASSRKELASVALAVAVRQGASKPDISTPAAAKKMFLAANSITFQSAAGGSVAGANADEMFKNLGIADQIQAKIKLPSRGTRWVHLLASGEAEIGIAFLSEMQEPGIDVVGPLPRGISTPVRLVGFVATHAKDPAAAKALLDYLASPEAKTAYKAKNLLPAR